MNGLTKVKSLGDLRLRARDDDRYKKLAEATAQNLGHSPRDYEHALRILGEEASAVELEGVADGEGAIVDEVNFCRDLV